MLDELEQGGLLDDGRYVGVFIRARSLRGVGPLKICAELQKHGIDRSRIQENAQWQETPWAHLAAEIRRKRFGDAPPVEMTMRAKQARFLQQRGFTSEQIQFALQNVEIE